MYVNVEKVSVELVTKILTVSSLDGSILGDFHFLLCELFLVISKSFTVNMCGQEKNIFFSKEEERPQEEVCIEARGIGGLRRESVFS